MREVTIILISLLLLGATQFKKPININHDILEAVKSYQENCDQELWRLDSIAEFRFDQESNWSPTKLTSFFYVQDTILKDNITYYDYSPTVKKYASRQEYRTRSESDAYVKVHSLQDSNLKNWSKEKGIIFLSNKTQRKMEEYQFRYDTISKDWYLYHLMVDSFDTNQLKKQRYFYSNIDPGNYPIQESKELFRYSDTLLKEKISIWRKGTLNEDWQKSKKETFEYQGNLLKEEKTYFFDEKENDWRLSKQSEWEYHSDNEVKIDFEFNQEDKSKIGYKTIEKTDGKKSFFIWNEKKQEFERSSTEEIKKQNDLIYEIVKLNYLSGYDQDVTEHFYDSQNRMTKTIHKNKNNEDKEWKILSETSYGYEGVNARFSSVKKKNGQGKIMEEMEIEFDKVGNPIKRFSKINGRGRELGIKHNDSIDSRNIIVPKGLKVFQTNIGENIWQHKNAPTLRIYYRNINGIKKEYKKIEYFYKKIK